MRYRESKWVRGTKPVRACYVFIGASCVTRVYTCHSDQSLTHRPASSQSASPRLPSVAAIVGGSVAHNPHPIPHRRSHLNLSPSAVPLVSERVSAPSIRARHRRLLDDAISTMPSRHPIRARHRRLLDDAISTMPSRRCHPSTMPSRHLTPLRRRRPPPSASCRCAASAPR